MRKRGRLSFSNLNKECKDEELKEAKEHWESFIDADAEEREKYLRELEIEFSFKSLVDDDADSETKDDMAKVFSDAKRSQQKKAERNRKLK